MKNRRLMRKALTTLFLGLVVVVAVAGALSMAND